MLGVVVSTAMGLVAMHAPQPRVLTPTQSSGYPKLYRCASPVQQPSDLPGFSPACRAWRTTELARIAALPVPARIERVAALRNRMGLSAGEGLNIQPDGTLVMSRLEMATR